MGISYPIGQAGGSHFVGVKPEGALGFAVDLSENDGEKDFVS